LDFFSPEARLASRQCLIPAMLSLHKGDGLLLHERPPGHPPRTALPHETASAVLAHGCAQENMLIFDRVMNVMRSDLAAQSQKHRQMVERPSSRLLSVWGSPSKGWTVRTRHPTHLLFQAQQAN